MQSPPDVLPVGVFNFDGHVENEGEVQFREPASAPQFDNGDPVTVLHRQLDHFQVLDLLVVLEAYEAGCHPVIVNDYRSAGLLPVSCPDDFGVELSDGLQGQGVSYRDSQRRVDQSDLVLDPYGFDHLHEVDDLPVLLDDLDVKDLVDN